MLDYYYIDLYFDPKQYSFEQVVRSCITSLIASGCRYEKVTMSNPEVNRNVNFGEHVALKPEELPAVAAAYVDEMKQKGQKFISFPPLGRVMFHYSFRLDEAVLDDIHEEEEDAHSSYEDFGLTFSYTTSAEAGMKIKASLNFWEEFVLKNGTPELQVENMRDILGMVVRIAAETPPYFGAMNTEIHLNTDASLSLLGGGKLPEGNEFALIGGPLMPKLDMKALKASKYPMGSLPDGGCVIQMADKWAGLKAV